MFINEYLMDHKRYEKWSTPVLYKIPIFYIYLFVFILGVIGEVCYLKYHLSPNVQTVSILLMFIAVYRGLLTNWMRANKQYRLMRQQYYGDKPWLCRVEIEDRLIVLYVNDKLNNDVHWDRIKTCAVAKSFIALKTENKGEAVMLDKACFTKGDAESFLKYMETNHKDIPIVEENYRYNK